MQIPVPNKRWLALSAAIVVSVAEIVVVFDGLRGATLGQIVQGMVVAMAQPLTAAFWRESRILTSLAFVLSLVVVLYISGQRVGSAIDRAEASRAQAGRALQLADANAKDASELLADAKAAAKKACGYSAKSKACVASTLVASRLLTTAMEARSTAQAAPVIAGEGNERRASELTLGYISAHQVSVFWPYFLAMTMQVLSSAFWGVWGKIRPVKSESRAQRNFASVLMSVVKPGSPRDKVEISDIYRGYVRACSGSGHKAAPPIVFGEASKQFADAAQLRVLVTDGKVYWCGVRLAK